MMVVLTQMDDPSLQIFNDFLQLKRRIRSVEKENEERGEQKVPKALRVSGEVGKSLARNA